MEKEKDDEQQVQHLMRLMSTNCNDFKMQCVGYISGFVVKMLQKLIKCDICLDACLDAYGNKEKLALELFDLKQRGPLLKPSSDVVKICATTENAITIMMNSTNIHNMLKEKLVKSRIIVLVIRKLSSNPLFPNLNSHQLQTKSSICISRDHIFTLINTIINCYCKVKFFHLLRIT